MNDSFSFGRFWLLFSKHMREEYKQYLLLSAGVLGIMMVLNGLTTFTNLHGMVDSKMHELLFMGGFVFGGSIFSSLTYQFFQNSAKGIRFLELPSSQLEKIAVMFVVTQFVFGAAFLVLFYINDWVMCTIYNTFHSMPPNVPAERLKYYHADLYNILSVGARRAVAVFLVFSAIAHFGSLVFQKIAFVKIALCTVIMVAIIYWVNYVHLIALIPEPSMPGGLFYNESVRLGEDDATRGFVLLPDNWVNNIQYILPGVLYISFWAGSYYKLREKQI